MVLTQLTTTVEGSLSLKYQNTKIKCFYPQELIRVISRLVDTQLNPMWKLHSGTSALRYILSIYTCSTEVWSINPQLYHAPWLVTSPPNFLLTSAGLPTYIHNLYVPRTPRIQGPVSINSRATQPPSQLLSFSLTSASSSCKPTARKEQDM